MFEVVAYFVVKDMLFLVWCLQVWVAQLRFCIRGPFFLQIDFACFLWGLHLRPSHTSTWYSGCWLLNILERHQFGWCRLTHGPCWLVCRCLGASLVVQLLLLRFWWQFWFSSLLWTWCAALHFVWGLWVFHRIVGNAFVSSWWSDTAIWRNCLHKWLLPMSFLLETLYKRGDSELFVEWRAIHRRCWLPL